MPGTRTTTKAIYHGPNTDTTFIVFISDYEAYQKWKGDDKSEGDKSIHLSEIVAAYRILVSYGEGVGGVPKNASKATLAAEFPELEKPDEENCITAILSKPSKDLKIERTQERGGTRDDSRGTRVAH